MDQYMKDLASSTLNEEERHNFWLRVDNLKWDLSGLGGLFQNPMPIEQENLEAWEWLVENLKQKLLQLQQDVAKTISAKI